MGSITKLIPEFGSPKKLNDVDGRVSEKINQASPETPNPYGFPERHLFKGIIYNGAPVRKLPLSVDSVEHIKRMRNLTMRNDDVVIAAFPKCGTHWVSEMLHMLMNGTTEHSSQSKEFSMLEFKEDLGTLDQMASPRLFNSHFYIAHLPEQILEKRVKLVHLIRNPRDCAVSMYHHWKQTASKEFTFDNFIRGYITEDYTTISHQLNYLRQMSMFERANPDHPVIHIHYEDLKRDPVPILQELSNFVGVQASWKFCEDVAIACGFNKLKKKEPNRGLPDHLYKIFPKDLVLFRKGIVGDWKNMFSVAQSEMFDKFLAEQEKKGQHYNFRH